MSGAYHSEYLIQRELSVTSHKPIRSLPVNIIQMILFLGNVVLACVYEYLISVDSETWLTGYQSPYSVLSYYHVTMWLLLLVLHQLLRKVHRASLAEGYFTFYRQTKSIKGAPFLIASCVNVFLLVLFMLLKDITDDSDKENNCKKWPVHIVVSFTLLELITAYTFIIKYILMVWHFNQSRAVPDFMLETDNFVTPRQDAAVLEIGFRDVDKAAEIIERQNDIIVHLKAKLQDMVRQRGGAGGSTGGTIQASGGSRSVSQLQHSSSQRKATTNSMRKGTDISAFSDEPPQT